MSNLVFINSIEDLERQRNHPYRIGEYLCDGTQVYSVSDDINENIALIESFEGEPDALVYGVNWEDKNLYTESGEQIPPVYG